MPELVKRKLVPVLISVSFGLVIWLFGVSQQAGALEQRVTDLERSRTQIEIKLDHVLALQYETREAVVRVESRLKK